MVKCRDTSTPNDQRELSATHCARVFLPVPNWRREVTGDSWGASFGGRRSGAMAKMNVWPRMFPVQTHEGAVAQKLSPKAELRRTVLTCLLWEDTFYEKGSVLATRIAALVGQCK